MHLLPRYALVLAACAALACSGKLANDDEVTNAPDAIAHDAGEALDGGGAFSDAPRARTAVPIFSVPGGIYATAQVVAITSATFDAAIYYTVDGSIPNESSNRYSSAVSVVATTTLRAIAIANGYEYSEVNSATYTLCDCYPQAAAPLISPAGGTFMTPRLVTITTSEPGGAIFFTTDGSLPTSAKGSLYTGPLTVATDTTILAVTTASNKLDSKVTTAVFKIGVGEVPLIVAPSLSPGQGEYASAVTITMSTTTAGATICYTIDGNTPTCDPTKIVVDQCTGTSLRYTSGSAPLVDKPTTVKAFACKPPSWITSDESKAAYTFRSSTPTCNVGSGTTMFDSQVIATVATPGATLLATYTTIGTTPPDPDVAVAGSCTPSIGTTAISAADLPWSIAKLIDPSSTGLRRSAKVKLRSCHANYAISAVEPVNLSLQLHMRLASSTPPFGPVSAPFTVQFDAAEIAATTLGADPTEGTFCYATDGVTMPSCSASKTSCIAGVASKGGGPSLSSNTTLRVVACKPSTMDSDVLEGNYTF